IAQYGCGGCAPKIHVACKYSVSSFFTSPSLCWYSSRQRKNSLQYHVTYGETPQTSCRSSTAFFVQSNRQPAYQSRLICCCTSRYAPIEYCVSVRDVSTMP